LLLNRFRGHEAHLRTAHGFTDSFGIIGIVLVGFHVGLYKLRSDQPHGVTKPADHTTPIVRAAAGFHPDHTRRHVGEETSHLDPA